MALGLLVTVVANPARESRGEGEVALDICDVLGRAAARRLNNLPRCCAEYFSRFWTTVTCGSRTALPSVGFPLP